MMPLVSLIILSDLVISFFEVHADICKHKTLFSATKSLRKLFVKLILTLKFSLSEVKMAQMLNAISEVQD